MPGDSVVLITESVHDETLIQYHFNCNLDCVASWDSAKGHFMNVASVLITPVEQGLLLAREGEPV